MTADTDNDGIFSQGEIIALLGLDPDDPQVAELMKIADQDNDNRVNLLEFLLLVMPED
jgi:Ca2+-binding EF-hand superfamily protein